MHSKNRKPRTTNFNRTDRCALLIAFILLLPVILPR